MNYDDILMTVIYLMKYMITNRNGEDEITFVDYCKTLYSQHIKETKHNPFIKLVVGDGYVGDSCINHVYISFNNFFVSQKERQFMIFFRYYFFYFFIILFYMEYLIILILIIILIIIILNKKEYFNNNDNPIDNLDAVIYINLENREDRKKLLLEELAKMNIPDNKIHKVSGVYIPKNGHKGCVQSHITALNIIKMNNWNKVLILEDDAILNVSPEEFKNELIKMFNYIDNNNFDVLMLSSCYEKKIK